MAPGVAAVQARNVAYFDHIAAEYAALYERRTPAGVGFRLRREKVLDLFDQPGGAVLDVGCGPGVLVDALLARGCTVTGLDPSRGMVEEATRRFANEPRARFVVAPGERTGLPDAAFDAVLCVGVLDRLQDPEPLLRETARVLKPGGSLLVTFSNRRSPYNLWRDHVYAPLARLARLALSRAQGRPAPASPPRHRLYDRAPFARRLGHLGLRLDAMAHTCFLFAPSPLDTLLARPVAASMPRLETLGRGPLRGLGACVVARAHKQPTAAGGTGA